MRVLTRALATLGLAALAGATSLSAQSASVGANRFYVGAAGGIMNFGTYIQSRGAIPMVNANALITANRAALYIGADVGLGGDEYASMTDPVDQSARTVTFDHINRFYFMLMAYPLKSNIQPFFGLGWGIQTLSNIQVQGSFIDADQQQKNQSQAEDLGSTGFMQLVAGVEVRSGILNIFGSIAAGSGENGTDLIRGNVYTLQGGVRFSLGKAKEDVE